MVFIIRMVKYLTCIVPNILNSNIKTGGYNMCELCLNTYCQCPDRPKEISVVDMQKIMDANEKLVKEVKDAKD